MKEKKNIDQLFKEQFQDFEATPPPAVWDRIEARLQEKKKERRTIPLWWRVAGVAALLALLLTVGISLFNSPNAPSNEIVNENTTQDVENTSDEDEIFNKKTISNGTEIASEEDNMDASENKTGTTVQNSEKTISTEKENTTVAGTQDNTLSPSAQTTGTAVATSESNTTFNKKTDQNNNQPKNASATYNTTTEAVATSNKPKNATKKSPETTQNPLVRDPKTVVSGNEAIAKNIQEEKVEGKATTTKNNGNVVDQKMDSKTAVSESSQDEDTQNKKSIFDAIEENKKLEDAVAVKEGPANRWAVSPNVGPVYYSSLSGGSSIDPMFADNSQNGNVNLSYGVAVDYNISEKLSIRSGVNNVNLSYATGDVEVATAPTAFGLENVDYGTNRSAITTVFDKGSIPPNPENGGLNNIVSKSTGGNAEISQQLQYYEVPLELKYAVLNKKIGINVIGGLSTLFLGNNEIVVSDGTFRTVLGEANNLNSISFTSNIGLGFNYQLSKKFRFNIEPMFKYQLNPYTDSSVDFRPYYLGVYSGLSFKF